MPRHLQDGRWLADMRPWGAGGPRKRYKDKVLGFKTYWNSMNGGDTLTLQRILGHVSLTMTMRYAPFAPKHLADTPDRSPLAKL